MAIAFNWTQFVPGPGSSSLHNVALPLSYCQPFWTFAKPTVTLEIVPWLTLFKSSTTSIPPAIGVALVFVTPRSRLCANMVIRRTEEYEPATGGCTSCSP
ncbi:MAG TPA: hypothetical protein PKH36_03655, partial [Flavobacteriales bacterium]|nr:hypothetical protein [Flavobacteriales bacterium]